MDDFRLGWSDIDFIALTNENVTESEAQSLLELRQKMQDEEPRNPYYRTFEGIIVGVDEYRNRDFIRLVYWGTSGQKITDSYTAEGIIAVNTYDTMMHHRDEYLYFHTDHHWTGRAAYYAYADFCKTAGVDAIPLDSMTAQKIEGYWGSLADSDV
ncbi:MAG: hypothetical protein II188_03110, partial [Ruminococcus sp.]|nr:hypothetical protein [Ruminococcus sp.]